MKNLSRIVPVSACVAWMVMLPGCDGYDAPSASVTAASNQTAPAPAKPAPETKPAAPAAPAKAEPAKPAQNAPAAPQGTTVTKGAAEFLTAPQKQDGSQPAAPPTPMSTEQIVKADPPVVDLGEIPTNDTKAGKVTLVNTGDKPMTVQSARPSCGCTALKFVPGTVIPAHEKIDVELQMNGGGHEGEVHGKTVTFVVEGQPEVVVQLKGKAISFVKYDPTALDPDSGAEGKLTLHSIDDKPFRVMSVMPQVVNDLSKDASATQELKISWEKFREIGVSRQLIVYLDHPKCQQVIVPVNFKQEEINQAVKKAQDAAKNNQKAIMPSTPQQPLPEDPDTILANMIKDGRNSEVLQKIQTGLNVNYRDSGGVSILSMAAKAGNVDLMKALIGMKADINNPDNVGRTPLMHAATSRNAEAVRMLLAANADMKLRDSLGGTALWWGAMQGDAETVQELIDKGADVEIVGSVTGWTPLIVASGFGDPASIEVLLKAHANIEATDMLEGATPLIHAARTGKVESMKVLLKHGAKLENADRNGNTPLLACAKNSGGDAEKVKFLIDAGANIHAKDNRGYNALDLARKRTDIRAPEVVKLLEPLLGNETPAAASAETKPAGS